MACHCSNCSKNKQIGMIRQIQSERCVRAKHKVYPKRTKKIWEDRIKAQEAVVRRHQEWYDSAVARSNGKTKYGWGDPDMYQRWLEGAKKGLEKVKAQAEKALQVRGKCGAVVSESGKLP